MPPISNSPRSKPTLIVFVKAPMPGDVKTRLLPHFDSQESAGLYRTFVIDILQNFSKISACKLLVAYQPHPKATDLGWTKFRGSLDSFKQEGKSLGERLTHAFGTAFGRGAQRVVIVGSDAPTLPNSYVEQAFEALEKSDVVLGPALDGGYYLIGLSRPCMRLFDDVCWSTDQVFEKTAKNAQNQGYSLKVLGLHYDVDTIDDVRTLYRDLTVNPALAPLTFKFLSSLLKTKPLTIDQ